MRILIGCEESGVVSRAFRERGHDAWSCDLIESAGDRSHHILGDVWDYLIPEGDGAWRCARCSQTCYGESCFLCGEKTVSCEWDMLIAFPPCTDLCVSGARWFAKKRENGGQQRSIDFFMALANCGIPKIAIENPVGIMSSLYRKPDQIIQPWQFGHGETKATCLWLKNLPKLTPTNIVSGREQRIWKMGPSENRAKERSRTFPGIGAAMAAQWG